MTEQQVKDELDKHNLSWDSFSRWMVGQTITEDKNGNVLYFPHDVERYIGMKITGTSTYFD